MEIVTNNPIVYDSGILDEEYENAYGRRRGRVRRRSGIGREGGRAGGRKRTGFNRAIGVIPVVAGARYLQRRRAEREDRERRQSQSSPSGARMSSESMQSAPRQSSPMQQSRGKVVGSMEYSKPSSQSIPTSQGRPSNVPPNRTNPLQGKPNYQQNVGIASIAAPAPETTPNNNKKIALIVGGVLLLGVAAYIYFKRKGNK
jgi:hypothetical protein